jgi:predicted dehydrogenase
VKHVLILLVLVSSLRPSLADDSAAPAADAIKEKVRVGVITQQNGPHLGIYFPALAVCSSISEVAVADPSGTTFASAKEMLGQYAEFQPFSDPAAMIDTFQPDLVLVALAAHRAPTRIHEALSAGCHVLAEKPACVRAEDFARLVGLANEKKLNLMLALPSRLAPDTRRAKEIVDAGWLGKPYGVTFFQVKDQARLTRPAYQDSWFADRDKAGGGHLIWLGIHNLDQVFFITNDRVERVTGFSNNVGGQPVGIEDAEAVAFHFRSGMVGTFHGGYYLEGGSYQAGTTLWGSRGWIRLTGYRGPDGSNRSFQWYSTHPDAPRGVQEEEEQVGVNSYQLLVQAAIDSARGARSAPLTGDDCLHVLKTIFGAYRASETGTAQTVR